MTKVLDWQWFGTPGHFIGSNKCCFHLHTRVGDYRISTVGCYHPSTDPFRIHAPEEIGSGRLFETMVFLVEGENEGHVIGDAWECLDSDGYNDHVAAEQGHVAMCMKWQEK